MNNLKNSKGVSLVELMAALALVSLVAVLIMTTLSIGIKRSVVENDKLRIQQEANILVSKLLADHRLGDPYCLAVFKGQMIKMDTIGNDPVKCVPDNETELTNIINSTNNSLYNADIYNINLVEESTDGLAKSYTEVALLLSGIQPINPKKDDVNLNITLSYKDPTVKKAKFSVNTTLSRYKTSGN